MTQAVDFHSPLSFHEHLKQVATQTHDFLDANLPVRPGLGQDLFKAMRHSSLSNGKCLRPFLVHACANLWDVPLDQQMRVGSSIEIVHTYSLIHDDLPAMDDDDMRRGKPSCHIAFDEATAILAGNALYSLAFEWLCDERTHANPSVRLDLVQTLLSASGAFGTIYGQMMDMEGEQKKLTLEEITELHRLKTGKLIAASCEMGAILGGAPQEERSILRSYAYDLGLAFQIIDDILDVEGDPELLGKPILSDNGLEKSTFVSLMGLDEAKKYAFKKAQDATTHLTPFGASANTLIEIANFVVERNR